jgi:hypothetical protein
VGVEGDPDGPLAGVGFTVDGSVEHTRSRQAQRLITSWLWPELGELLDDETSPGEED